MRADEDAGGGGVPVRRQEAAEGGHEVELAGVFCFLRERVDLARGVDNFERVSQPAGRISEQNTDCAGVSPLNSGASDGD